MSNQQSAITINWYTLSVSEVIKELETDAQRGLSEAAVKHRQQKFGFNVLPEEKRASQFRIFLEQFRNPLIYILILAGIVTLFVGEYTDSAVIFGAVFLNTIIGFVQENKVVRAVSTIKKVIKCSATALREGNLKIIDAVDLAPGDILVLAAGDKIPADGRIIECHNFKVNEAVLTGEWLAAQKKFESLPKDASLADRDNMVYLGTTVEEGRAEAVVTAIGANTEIGKVARLVRETAEGKTPYQKKLSRFSKIVGFIIAFICVGIFIEGVIAGGRFLEMFMTAVAVAVAAIPEGLPVALTVILALGMQRILKKKGLVRKMSAAETLGSTSVICTDKTGTLTEAKMQVAGVFTENKELRADGHRYSERIDINGGEPHILAFKIGMLCTEAFIENPEDELKTWIIRGRPMERALLLAGIQAGFSKKTLEKEQPKIDEVVFDPVYKYSASLHRLSSRENVLYILGAPETILDFCGFSPGKSARFAGRLNELACRGSRVLACAYKKFSAEKQEINENDFRGLTFVAFITFHDPLRKDAGEAVKLCQKAGLKVVIVTGDHKLTARAVAEELGLSVQDENIMEGSDLERLSDGELAKRLPDIAIFARTEPRQKLRIVRAWQKAGEVVAMTGDGVNDAPALKQADIGVALGSGTEVAKETADLVLLNDSFSIIAAAVEEGRAILDNIRKVITYLLSDSFTEVILISFALLFGFPLPVTAAQILWVNLIEDGLPNIALAFEPKDNDLMKLKPAGHNAPLLTGEMKTLIFIIGFVTDFLLLGLLYWFLKYSNYEIIHIRSLIFAALAIDSLFYVFSCKNLRRNLWQIDIFSNKFLLFSWFVGAAALAAALYFAPLRALLKTVPLSLFDWCWLLGLALVNLILIEFTKWCFIKRQAA